MRRGREMKIVVTLSTPKQFHLTASLCRLPRPLRGRRRGAGGVSGSNGCGGGGSAGGGSGRVVGARGGIGTAGPATRPRRRGRLRRRLRIEAVAAGTWQVMEIS